MGGKRKKSDDDDDVEAEAEASGWKKNERRTQLHTESELQSILINYLSLNILFDLEMNNTIFILTY